MSRNLLAFAGVLLVGALLWMVSAWPASRDDDSAQPIADEAPAPAPAPPAAPEPEPPAEPAEPPLAAKPPAAPEAPQPPQPPQEQPPPPEPEVPTDMFLEDQGPVAELKHVYESEPRDSAASAVESVVRAAFAHPDGAPDLFRSVICRQTVCKIDMRWAPDRMGAYVAGMTRASLDFAPEFAVSPAGPAGSDQTRPIVVYLKRKPPTAAN
jgi:type IV secretory pathway VirB10-like protein